MKKKLIRNEWLAKTKHFLLLLIIFLPVLSCDTGEDDLEKTEEPDVDENPIEVPVGSCKLSDLSFDYGDYSEAYSFAYDENGKLISMAITENSSGTIESDEFFLNYTNGIPSSLDYIEDGIRVNGEVTFEYDGENLAKIVLSSDEGLGGDDEEGEGSVVEEYRLSYSANKITIDFYRNGEKDDEVFYLDLVDENVVKITENYTSCYSEGGSDEEICEEVTEIDMVTYDDKINPLQGNLLYLIYEGEWELFFSSNNATAYTYTDEDGSETDSYAYSYDDDGFPISIADEEGNETSLVYECD